MRSRQDAGHGPAAAGTALALAASMLLPASAPAQDGDPVPTRVTVRAVAQDAKVIGSGVGGALVTIRAAASGEVLARGVQLGGTGDTDRIMRRPVARGDAVYAGGDAAAFETTLMLRAPLRIEVEAEAPLAGPPASRQSASKTLWVWPGRHLEGQGIVLELHGFAVEILRPEPGATVAAGDTVEVEARVEMMCGCPTEPGGMWDADRYEMSARLVRDGAVVRSVPVRYAGETSRYRASVPVERPGDLRLELLVADTARANVGRAVTTIRAGRR